LIILNQNDFKDTTTCLPQPYKSFDDIDPSILARYDLPVVLVPPEVIELDSLSADAGEETHARKQEWPEFFIRLFSNEVSHYDDFHPYYYLPSPSRYLPIRTAHQAI
jgi:nuclear cap-binding protein subunit 1